MCDCNGVGKQNFSAIFYSLDACKIISDTERIVKQTAMYLYLLIQVCMSVRMCVSRFVKFRLLFFDCEIDTTYIALGRAEIITKATTTKIEKYCSESRSPRQTPPVHKFCSKTVNKREL